MAPPKEVVPKRGQVWLVDFDPTVGHEVKKTRPALILQNDVANRYSPVTIVAAITSSSAGKAYPTEVNVARGEAGLTADSLILLNQIRTVDKRRLLKRLRSVGPETMARVDSALAVSLGLVDL
jgi:mRNA interferase MazF